MSDFSRRRIALIGGAGFIGHHLALRLKNLGAQVDLKVVIFTNLSATLSFGYGYAWGGERPSGTEFMASLKIM